MDIAVVGVGVSVTLNNGTIQSARISLGAVAPTPILVDDAAQALIGQSSDDEEAISTAGKIAKEAASPISDMRGTIEYRKHLCDVLTKRALKAAITRAKGGKVDAH
jgi:carbon-monoxide dehydrogenase medium subunit